MRKRKGMANVCEDKWGCYFYASPKDLESKKIGRAERKTAKKKDQ